MFDFGFTELFLIIVVAIFVIGPQDIPDLLRNLGRGVRRLQYMRYAVSAQFESFMRENDLNEVRHFSVDPHPPIDPIGEKEADEALPALTLTDKPEETDKA